MIEVSIGAFSKQGSTPSRSVSHSFHLLLISHGAPSSSLSSSSFSLPFLGLLLYLPLLCFYVAGVVTPLTFNTAHIRLCGPRGGMSHHLPQRQRRRDWGRVDSYFHHSAPYSLVLFWSIIVPICSPFLTMPVSDCVIGCTFLAVIRLCRSAPFLYASWATIRLQPTQLT